MSKKIKKTITTNKTAAVFGSFSLPMNDMFIHCSRIPDVMVRVVKAREILKRYRVQVPSWMFGLMHKGEIFDSPVHFQLMSFLISLGLYDRLVRLEGKPDFLMGYSQALLVSAKVKTFESSVIRIFCGLEKKKDSIRVYKKIQKTPLRFSLCHFSNEPGNELSNETIKNMAKQYGVDCCILISPSAWDMRQKSTSFVFCTVKGLIEMDPQLAWFWPILQNGKLKPRKTLSGPFSLDTFFK